MSLYISRRHTLKVRATTRLQVEGRTGFTAESNFSATEAENAFDKR